MAYDKSNNYTQTVPEEDLRLNSLLFTFPTEPVTFWFSKADRKDVSLMSLSHQLFPVNIDEIFPGLGNGDTHESLDLNTISGLIDQVYQFSRIYWKSLRQQNLPVTIKYPEMVAKIAPYFTVGNLPDNMGRDDLWFL